MADWKKIIVSGSSAHLNQITASGNILSDGTIEGSIVTSSNLNPLLHFNGSRSISNADLPGIYLKNFGTQGDLKDFIEAVFFTNTPPEIPPSQSFRIQEWTTGEAILGTMTFRDDEFSNEEINQNITFSIEDNHFFKIMNDEFGGTARGQIRLKSGVTVSKSLNTHPSESAQGTISTFPLNVTLTDEVGSSDTEKIYIHIIPNEKPELFDNNGATLTLLSTDEVNEYGDIKTIYEYTSSARNESFLGANTNGIVQQGNAFAGHAISHSDANNDSVSFTGDYLTQLDSNGDQYIDFLPDTSHKRFFFRQITASFDFESSSFFNFTITASDQHYPSPDTSSVVYLKYHLPIADNPPPAIIDQNFTINENKPDGTEVINSPIDIDDTETLGSGKAFFLINSFNLIAATEGPTPQSGLNYMLQPHNITNSLANDGDGGFFNPNKDPFQVSLDGRITKKPSTFLNADIAKYYYYSASVTDIYNENQSSSFAIMRIEIQDDTLPTLTLNHPTDNFIIESALTSNFVVQDSHGDSSQGSISTFARSTVNNVAENVNWIVNTVPPNLIAGAVDVTGTTTPNLLTSSLIGFRPIENISESIYTFDAGNTIKVEVTASKDSFPSSQVFNDFTLNIAKNNSPNINAGANPAVSSFNEVTEGTTLYTLTLSDIEGDTIDFDTFELTGPQPNTLTQLSSSHNNSNIIFIHCRNQLSGSTDYNFTASVKDNHAFRTSSISRSFSIAKQNTGSLSRTAGTYFLIESALNGDGVFNSSSGYSGTQVSFSVDYGNAGGNPQVQSFTASVQTPFALNNYFSISSGSTTNGGLLSLRQNVSGTVEIDSNDPIVLTISYQDQYGNIGGGSVTDHSIVINPVPNKPPAINETGNFSSIYTDSLAVQNSVLKQYNIPDPEGDSVPTNVAITSSDTTNGLIASNNGTTLNIKANQNLSVGTYHFTASVRDEHNFSTSSISGSISIAKDTTGTLTGNNTTVDLSTGNIKFFVQELGESGDIIHTLTGIDNSVENGSQANLDVDYGSTGLSVSAFASSNALVNVDNNGLLTLGQNLSESVAAGDIITVPITYTDNSYSSNQKTENIKIEIFAHASNGILGGNATTGVDGSPKFFVQELGQSGDIIHTEAGIQNGTENGSQANLDVSYITTTETGLPSGLSVSSFDVHSDSPINLSITSDGLLTLNENISGSVSPGQIYTIPIHFTDDGNPNSGDSTFTKTENIFIEIFANASLGNLTANNSSTHTNGKPKFFLQECAESGDIIHTQTEFHSTTGNPNGSQADLGATYNNEFGQDTGLDIGSFSISNTSPLNVGITTPGGLLTVNQNISSSFDVGQILEVPINFTDNGGSTFTKTDSVFVEIFANDEPNYVPVSETLINGENPDISGTISLPLTANTVIRTFKITDKEHDFPYTASLGGTDANKFYIASSSNNNNESTTYEVKILNDLENDTSNQVLSYKIIMKDNVGKTTETGTINTNFIQAPAKVFAYAFELGSAADILSNNVVQQALGGDNEFNFGFSNHLDSSSIDNILSGSVLAHFMSGSIGSTFNPAFYLNDDFPLTNKPCTLNNSANLTALKGTSGIESLGQINLNGAQGLYLIVFPSSSNLANKPRDLRSSAFFSSGETPDNQYIYKVIDSTTNNTVTSKVIYFNTSQSYFGYNTWGMIHSLGYTETLDRTLKLVNTTIGHNPA